MRHYHNTALFYYVQFKSVFSLHLKVRTAQISSGWIVVGARGGGEVVKIAWFFRFDHFDSRPQSEREFPENIIVKSFQKLSHSRKDSKNEMRIHLQFMLQLDKKTLSLTFHIAFGKTTISWIPETLISIPRFSFCIRVCRPQTIQIIAC